MTDDPKWLASAIFAALVVGLFALDLGMAARVRSGDRPWLASSMSVLWITGAAGFTLAVHFTLGHVRMLEFVTGYLIEYALSVDNLFVFLTIFSYFQVPRAQQHRVLFWGILTAVVLRLLFILAGTALLRRFHWFEYVLGALLLSTALRILWGGASHVDPERSPIVRVFRRFVPSVARFDGGRFLVRTRGGRRATLLLLVLVLIEATDIVFALDSIPAIFAVTQDPFIVYTSNVLAVAGLRSLYGVLSGMIGRLVYLRHGLGSVLLFVAGKMLLHDLVHVPTPLSLIVIVTILATAAGASLLHGESGPPGGPPHGR